MTHEVWVNSPVGGLRVHGEFSQQGGWRIHEIEFLTQMPAQQELDSKAGDSELSNAPNTALAMVIEQFESKVKAQLTDYFSNPEKEFEFNLALAGTAFQKRVWQLMRSIPVGEVRTYGWMAKQLKSSAQAVGNACRCNPVPIIVPCHRVVAAGGIGGFAGKRTGKLVAVKQWLLQHEGAEIEC